MSTLRQPNEQSLESERKCSLKEDPTTQWPIQYKEISLPRLEIKEEEGRGDELESLVDKIFDRSTTSEFRNFVRQWMKTKFDEVNLIRKIPTVNLIRKIPTVPTTAQISAEAHYVVNQFTSLPSSGQYYWKITLDELEALKQTSAMIQSLYDEAEVRQFTSLDVKLWLDLLKKLLYDAEDILDEYTTEVLRLKLESAHQTQQGIKRFGSNIWYANESIKRLRLGSGYSSHPHHQTQQVSNPVPLAPSSQSIVSSFLKSGIESAVKLINERLEEIEGIEPKFYNFIKELQGIKSYRSKVRDINKRLNFEEQGEVAMGLRLTMGSESSWPGLLSHRLRTSSLVNSSQVFGRKDEMLKIVKWLLSDKTLNPIDSGKNFCVLPIVGVGGAGKTTLAQLVYNHEAVQKHFVTPRNPV